MEREEDKCRKDRSKMKNRIVGWKCGGNYLPSENKPEHALKSETDMGY
jgi:hypothetical protein